MNFLAHAAAHGLLIETLIADGRWHRARTEDKPRRKNGAYAFDGMRGAVINFATMTKAAVFRPDGRVEYIDRGAIRKMQAENARKERDRQEQARRTAADMMKRAAYSEHPYLAAKGFPKEKGFVLEGDLLIPMRDFDNYQQVNSIQRIAVDGSKLFLPGGRAKGSVWLFGSWLMQEEVLCEGYATGLSLRAAMGHLHRHARVIVCFSAGNLAHIGKLMKKRRSAFVVADNDKSGAGAQAAEETGLRWCMPPEVGMDANDLHQRNGLRALVDLIRWADRGHGRVGAA